jgi:hypothetical protein
MWWTTSKWLHKSPHFDRLTWSGRRLLMSLHNGMLRGSLNFFDANVSSMKSSCCGGMIKT